MGPVDARTLLDDLLSDGELQVPDVDQLLAHVTPEGVHLEYKAWAFIEGKGAGERVRKWVAGFANSDGGVLLIGFHENRSADGRLVSVSLDGDPASDRANDASEWASRALTDIGHLLWPPPRIKALEHHGKPVLAVAVARAPNLVACVEDRRPVYYLRLGDQTLTAPAYLHADIATGRRARPVIAVQRDVKAKPVAPNVQAGVVGQHLQLLVTNEGMVWANSVAFACIGLMADTGQPLELVGKALRQYMDVLDRTDDWAKTALLRAVGGVMKNLRPLELFRMGVPLQFPFPPGSEVPCLWRGVLYLLPEDCPPSFWQVDVMATTSRPPEYTLAQLHDGERGVVSLGPARTSG